MSKAQFHVRDSISGLHHHQDIQDGEYSASALEKRNDARQQDLNERIKGDWGKNMLDARHGLDAPDWGDAPSRLQKPTDVSSRGADRYGVSSKTPAASPGKPEQAPKKFNGENVPPKDNRR